MVALRAMRPEELAVFRDVFIEDWAADLAKVEDMPMDQARTEATRRTDADLRDALSSDEQRLYVIIADDQQVGTLWFSFADGRAFLNDITVRESCRGNGYGHRALELMEVELRSLEVSLVQLNVYAHNPRARSLYETLGYRVTGVKMTKQLET